MAVPRVESIEASLSGPEPALVKKHFGGRLKLSDGSLPMRVGHVSATISGTKPEFVNLIRQVVVDGLTGTALSFSMRQHGGDGMVAVGTPLQIEPLLWLQIRAIPLSRSALPELLSLLPGELEYELDVDHRKDPTPAEQMGSTARVVYSGDLRVVKWPKKMGKERPLFDPTYVIAHLEVGQHLVVNGITLVTGAAYGIGADAAPEFSVCVRGGSRYLDVALVDEDEMRRVPPDLPQRGVRESPSWSGYVGPGLDIPHSTTSAPEPTKFLLTFVAPAVDRGDRAFGRRILKHTCLTIKDWCIQVTSQIGSLVRYDIKTARGRIELSNPLNQFLATPLKMVLFDTRKELKPQKTFKQDGSGEVVSILINPDHADSAGDGFDCARETFVAALKQLQVMYAGLAAQC